MDRDKLVAEWCRLVGKEAQQVAQVAPAMPQYEKRGVRDTARQLGLDEKDVARAMFASPRIIFIAVCFYSRGTPVEPQQKKDSQHSL